MKLFLRKIILKKYIFWVTLRNHPWRIKLRYCTQLSKIAALYLLGGGGWWWWETAKGDIKSLEKKLNMKTYRLRSFWVQIYIKIPFLEKNYVPIKFLFDFLKNFEFYMSFTSIKYWVKRTEIFVGFFWSHFATIVTSPFADFQKNQSSVHSPSSPPFPIITHSSLE